MKGAQHRFQTMIATAVNRNNILEQISPQTLQRDKRCHSIYLCVYNSRPKGTATTYRYINSANYSTYILGMSGNQNITLPQFPAHYLSIMGRKWLTLKCLLPMAHNMKKLKTSGLKFSNGQM
jgi:hypothetical protein